MVVRAVEDGIDAIAEQVHQHALKTRLGGLTWMSLTYLPRSNRYSAGLTGPGLYDGSIGVALFLAAHASQTANTQSADAARQVATYALNLASRSGHDAPHGLGDGVAGICVGAAAVGRFLCDPDLLNASRDLAMRLGTKDSSSPDFMAGAAGVIASLLLIAEWSVDGEGPIQQAKTISEAIRTKYCSGPGWNGLEDGLLFMGNGFAHGMGGVGEVLRRLANITDNTDLLEASHSVLVRDEKISAERHLLPGAAGELSWCRSHLSVKASSDVAWSKELSSRGLPMPSMHNLCCGTAGVLDQEITPVQPGDLGIRSGQIRTLCDLADSASRHRLRLLPGVPAGTFLPGLFQGASGVGFTLLRSLSRNVDLSLLSLRARSLTTAS